MAQITVTIDGKAYRMACEEGQEDHLTQLADRLDRYVGHLKGQFGEIGDLLAAAEPVRQHDRIGVGAQGRQQVVLPIEVGGHRWLARFQSRPEFDQSTLSVLPWRPQQGRVVRFYCHIMNTDGTPYAYDTRRILTDAVARYEATGHLAKIGTECEFYLFRTDEANLSLAESGRPWAFDAPGDAFKLAAESYRINLAHLFDPMMAVHTSNVEPLPHQITAVYESMLPRQPLRYVLADDPGAGKTIMAGLFIRELLMRADAKRVLIVAPGSLVEQWQDEMFEKFGLSFTLFSREQVEQSRSGNPFDDFDLLIARVDQLARSEDLQEKLMLTQWDLVVVDEAHKL